jgi:hypothetical protein
MDRCGGSTPGCGNGRVFKIILVQGVGVHIDNPGEDEHPRHIDYFLRARRGNTGFHGGNLFSLNRHIPREKSVPADNRSALYQKIESFAHKSLVKTVKVKVKRVLLFCRAEVLRLRQHRNPVARQRFNVTFGIPLKP